MLGDKCCLGADVVLGTRCFEPPQLAVPAPSFFRVVVFTSRQVGVDIRI